jgi:2-polyprenyl-6-methoxyphenol hydroxylase-like FAD-dependent oxidoreductase
MTKVTQVRTDALIIGGGPAGLSAAIAIRLKGFEVTVVDAAHPPIDKACGEGIPPAGVEILQRLGLRLSGEAFPLRGIRFLDRGASVEASFPFGPGLALRRTRLHNLLVNRAEEVGVRLLWGTPVSENSSLPPCRWLVGADGQNSSVRHAAGLDAVKTESFRFGFRQHYRISPWTDFVEVHWGSRCQVYVTPVSDDEIGIALLSRDSHLRLDTAMTEFPELQRRLHGALTSSAERGAMTVSRRLRRVFRDRTVLIGDASGSVDAITGEGLSLSFHHAVALSDALCHGRLASYQCEHSRLARRPAFVAAALLSLDRFPALRRTIFKALALDPPIFGKLLTTLTADEPS